MSYKVIVEKTSKIIFLELNTALIMKSVSLEIEARQLLLNQFKTNKSVRLRD